MLKTAIEALERARKLLPKSATVLVGLGLASLVTTNGISDAEKYFDQASALVDAGQSDLDKVSMAALICNRGVIQIAGGKTREGQNLIARAKALNAELVWQYSDEIPSAYNFNAAAALAADGKPAEAVKVFETYLRSTPTSNPWWKIAYERYSQLNKALGQGSIDRSKLSERDNTVRRHVGVTMPSGKFIHIGQRMTEVTAELGTPSASTTTPTTGLRRHAYEKHGLVIFASDMEVFAIMIVAQHGPKLQIRESELGGKVVGEIRWGMSRKDVEALPCGRWRTGLWINLTDKYPINDQLGVAMVYGSDEPDAKVVGILISAIPLRNDELTTY